MVVCAAYWCIASVTLVIVVTVVVSVRVDCNFYGFKFLLFSIEVLSANVTVIVTESTCCYTSCVNFVVPFAVVVTVSRDFFCIIVATITCKCLLTLVFTSRIGSHFFCVSVSEHFAIFEGFSILFTTRAGVVVSSLCCARSICSLIFFINYLLVKCVSESFTVLEGFFTHFATRAGVIICSFLCASSICSLVSICCYFFVKFAIMRSVISY